MATYWVRIDYCCFRRLLCSEQISKKTVKSREGRRKRQQKTPEKAINGYFFGCVFCKYLTIKVYRGAYRTRTDHLDTASVAL